MRRLNERNEDFQSSLMRLKYKAILSNFPKKLTNRTITTASSWSSIFPPNLTTPTSSKEILAWSTVHPSLLKLSEDQRELKPLEVVIFKGASKFVDPTDSPQHLLEKTPPIYINQHVANVHSAALGSFVIHT